MGQKPNSNPEPAEAPNPFDPARYRLDTSADLVGGVKLIVNVPVTRPPRQDYIRVHRGEDYRMETAILGLDQDGESFLVDKKLHSALAVELQPVTLFTAITRAGLLFVWPVRLPDSSGRRNPWTETALAGARQAMTAWTRITSNRSISQYEIRIAEAKLPDPEWPALSFPEILQKAFPDVIDSPDHPAQLRLAGKL